MEAWFRPLTPVPLGEALLIHVLETAPGLPSELLGDASEAQAARVLTVLAQGARSAAERSLGGVPPSAFEIALRRALVEHMPHLWPTAVAVAQEAGGPLGRLVADALEATADPELAADIDASLPKRTVALRELGEVATRQALQHARSEPPSPERDGRLAQLLNNQSNRLSDLGGARTRWPRSRKRSMSTRAGAGAARRLPARPRHVAEQPVGPAERPGRREDALAAIEEAVDVYRELARARPDAFLPDLATSLNNQSNRLSDLGRREDALAAIEEAVDVYPRAGAGAARRLPARPRHVAEQPVESVATWPREDAAIEDLSILLRAARAAADAFLPDPRHVERPVGRQRPWRRGRAGRDRGSGRCLPRWHWRGPTPSCPTSPRRCNQSTGSDLGRREDALAAIEEAVDVYRELALALPDAFLPDLAMSLNNQSNRLSDLGRREDALAAIEEAVAIRRELARARPDAFLPDLAMSLNNQSIGLANLGRREDALAAIEEAVAIRRELARARPDAFLPHPRHVREPVEPAGEPGAARGRAGRDRGSGGDPSRAGAGAARRLPA